MRTRFTHPIAQSLDISAARIALVNLLVARAADGRYMIRLDDTEATPSLDQAPGIWLDSLRWLLSPWRGDDRAQPWDEGPLISSTVASKHRDVARLLMDHGAAYYCFASPGELEAYRLELIAEGKPELPGKLWRRKPPEETERMLATKQPHVIRLKMPEEGTAAWTDLLQGSQSAEFSQFDDPVLVRRDGTATYHLASVGNDHTYGITHVIRDERKMPWTPVHLAMYRYLGQEPPEFGHLPDLKVTDAELNAPVTLEQLQGQGYSPGIVASWLLGMQDVGAEPASEMMESFTLSQIAKDTHRRRLSDLSAMQEDL